MKNTFLTLGIAAVLIIGATLAYAANCTCKACKCVHCTCPVK